MLGRDLSDEYQRRLQFGWQLAMRNVLVVYDVKVDVRSEQMPDKDTYLHCAGAFLPHC
jgi:hypothetical protein